RTYSGFSVDYSTLRRFVAPWCHGKNSVESPHVIEIYVTYCLYRIERHVRLHLGTLCLTIVRIKTRKNTTIRAASRVASGWGGKEKKETLIDPLLDGFQGLLAPSRPPRRSMRFRSGPGPHTAKRDECPTGDPNEEKRGAAMND